MLEDSILLRSQSVDGVTQEIWGILLAYNLVRVEISRIAAPGTIPKKLKALRARIKRYILPKERKRPKNRTVRISKTR